MNSEQLKIKWRQMKNQMEDMCSGRKVKPVFVIFLNEDSSLNEEAYMKQLKQFLPFQQPKSSAKLQTIPENPVQATGHKGSKRKSEACDNFLFTNSACTWHLLWAPMEHVGTWPTALEFNPNSFRTVQPKTSRYKTQFSWLPSKRNHQQTFIRLRLATNID